MPALKSFTLIECLYLIKLKNFFPATALPERRILDKGFLCKISSTSQLLKAGPLAFSVL